MEPRTSFWKLLSDGKLIEIPALQRDYTHGRSGESPAGKMATQVRNAFIDSIDNVLTADSFAELCLDFMFGPRTNDRFFPIDGQQRLTTLFLYHWYLIPDSTDRTPLSRFKHHTRDSSNAFCTLLAETYRSSLISVDRTISQAIMDLGKYFLRWNNDPTVEGMLVVLDEMHTRWKGRSPKVHDQAWARMTDPIHPAVYFFIPDRDNDKEKSGDLPRATVDGGAADLYIRMNARGKPLTPFEKFKAWLEEYVDTAGNGAFSKEVVKWEGTGRESKPKSWKALLDAEWTDLFWEHDDGNHIVDEEFLRFFTTIAVCDYAREIGFRDDEVAAPLDTIRFKSIAPDTSDETYVPTHLFEEHHVFNERNLRMAFEVLEALALNGESNLREAFTALGRWSNRKAEDHVPVVLEAIVSSSPPPTYNDRVRFFAVVRFIAPRRAAIREGDAHTTGEIARFARIIDNIVGNIQTERESDFANRIRQIDRLIHKIEENLDKGQAAAPYSVYHAFQDLSAPEIDTIAGAGSRLQEQLTEERRKCEMIVNDHDSVNNSWERVIIDAETKSFTRGRIAFLLDYAKTVADTDERKTKSALKLYASIVDAMFHTNRTVYDSYENENTPQPVDQYRSTFLLRRALLTKGYFNFETGHNWSFCGNPGDAAAERRQWYSQGFTVSHGDTEPLMFRLMEDISGTLNDVNVQHETVRDILQEIVDEYLHDHPNPNDWRWWFIMYPELLKYSDYNETQWHRNDALTYLLKRRRLNGRHVEIVSFSFYREAVRRCPVMEDDAETKDRSKAFPPFNHFGYYEPTNGDEPPRVFLDITIADEQGAETEYALDIRFEGNSHEVLTGDMVLRFFDRKNGPSVPNEIVKALESIKFVFSQNEKLPGYERRIALTPSTWLDAPMKAIDGVREKLHRFV